MKLWSVAFSLLGAMSAAAAGDRVYTADQTSNTVSVIDPATNKLLGSIHLGEDVPAALSPLYRGELLVHGLGFFFSAISAATRHTTIPTRFTDMFPSSW